MIKRIVSKYFYEWLLINQSIQDEQVLWLNFFLLVFYGFGQMYASKNMNTLN